MSRSPVCPTLGGASQATRWMEHMGIRRQRAPGGWHRPSCRGVQAHPTSSSPLKAQAQLEGNRATQHMVCCKGCTGTCIALRRLSNEENKWCFVACSRYVNINSFTSSCVQVSGYSAQCISTNRFTPSLQGP